jgi:two-component system nitrogen regulation response regulator GlnG
MTPVNIVRIEQEPATESKGLAATVERHLRDYFAAHENALPSTGLYGRVLQEIERPLLAIALAECGGNQLRTAELLGLNRNTLRKKIRDLGLEARRTRKDKEKGSGKPANDSRV